MSWDVPASQRSPSTRPAGAQRQRDLDRGRAAAARDRPTPASFIKVQVGDQTEEVGATIREALAEAAGVDVDDVSVNLVSSSWGSEITKKAVRALVDLPRPRRALHLAAVRVADGARRRSWRWCTTCSISVGIYSLFGFEVTPATVDRVPHHPRLLAVRHDRRVRQGPGERSQVRHAEAALRRRHQRVDEPGADALAEHELLVDRCRSCRCCSSAPACSGQVTLAEFALALLVGMVTGAYSSIFVAAPLLGILKRTRPATGRQRKVPRPSARRSRDMVIGRAASAVAAPAPAAAERAVAAPRPPTPVRSKRPAPRRARRPRRRRRRRSRTRPRPRKKKRR